MHQLHSTISEQLALKHPLWISVVMELPKTTMTISN